jgi:hypothetical protein
MPIIIDARETRPEILDLVARARPTETSDEAYFLAQLRAAIAGIEGLATPFTVRTRAPRLGVAALGERGGR